MAGPGGKEVARVSVRVLPDTTKFGPALEKYLERTEQRLRLNLPVSLDQGDVAKIEAQLSTLTRDRTVNLDVDTERLSKRLTSLTSGGGRGFGFLSPGVIAAAAVAIAALGAALPGILAAIALPIASIAAGLEGIKKAAEVLVEPFKELQAVVSATFEKGLAPAMESIADLFPTLERGLTAIAGPLITMFTEVADALTLADMKGQLDAIFGNIADALTQLAPAIGPFVDSLLLLAESGTKAFAEFAPVLKDLTVLFNQFLTWAESSGVLEGAMRQIGVAIAIVAGFVGGLIVGTIILLDAFDRLVRFVVGMPDMVVGAWSAITTAISTAWSTITSKVSSGVSAVRSRITSAWASVRSATSSAWSAVTSAVSRAASSVVKLITGIPGKIKSFVSKMATIGKNAAEGFGRGILGVLTGIVSKVQQKIDDIVSAFEKALKIKSPSRVMMQIGKWTGEGFQVGLEDAFAGVEKAALALAGAPIEATVASRMLPGDFGTGGDRPIRMANGTLFGWIREIANGEAELVLNEQINMDGVLRRMG